VFRRRWCDDSLLYGAHFATEYPRKVRFFSSNPTTSTSESAARTVVYTPRTAVCTPGTAVWAEVKCLNVCGQGARMKPTVDRATQATLTAIVAALVASAALADTRPSFGMFTSYQSARQSLLRQGWLPWRLPNATSCSPQDDRCRGRPEMLSCDAGGSATCVFTWKKGSSVIEVTTRGKGSSPGVTRVKCQSGCGSP